MNTNVTAVRPAIEYRSSFLAAVAEYRAAGEEVYASMYAGAEVDFAGFVAQLEREEQGIGLPDGYVPCSQLWLVTPGDEVVGVVRVRHRLSWMNERGGGHIGYDVPPQHRAQGYGTLCLTHGLAKAKELGIQRVLITCSPDNVASRRIILRHGGVFESEVDTEPDGRKLRFWISLAPDSTS